MTSYILYHRPSSCSEDDFFSFIKEINDGIRENLDHYDIEEKVLSRLRICINERLNHQKFYKITKITKIIQSHLNIIKAYYDFYIKLQRYFPILLILLSEKLVSIEQLDYKGYYNHTVWLFIQGTYIPFTDISKNPKYLIHLDFEDDFDTDYNLKILNKYVTNWLNYPQWINNNYVSEFEKILKESESFNFRSFRKSKRKSVRKSKSKRKSKSIRKRKSVRKNKSIRKNKKKRKSKSVRKSIRKSVRKSKRN